MRDREYLLAVKQLPCCLMREVRVFANVALWSEARRARLLEQYLNVAFSTCEGAVEADHAGERPFGRKADDDTAIPLCRKHHRERTDYTGAFRGYTAVSMRLWCDWAISLTRALLGKRSAA